MNKFSEKMKEYSVEELLEMINNHSEDYVQEAKEAIIHELIIRGMKESIAPENLPDFQEPESSYDVAIREVIEMERNANN